MALSTDNILRAVTRTIEEMSPKISGRYLDIGAGRGELIQLITEKFQVSPAVCDYTDKLLRVPGLEVTVVDLNTEPLPFAGDAFDLITCTEVIEHIEHYRRTLREIFHVLKPEGLFVLTTPNVLNLRSRIRFLLFGFFSLFGPLHWRESERYLTGGHINPMSLFYVAHALSDAGFEDLHVSIDKKQRASLVWLIFLWLPIWLFSRWAIFREKTRFKTIDAQNEPFVRRMNSVDLLVGRTLVVGCRKKV